MSTEKTLLKARALAKRGDINQARSLYAAILQKYPGNKRALAGLKSLPQSGLADTQNALNDRLLALFKSGRFQELVATAEAALAADPGRLELLEFLGIGRAALGQHDAAIAAYDQIIAHAPGNADAYGNRGNAQKSAGLADAALDSFTKVLELRPGDPTALNNIGTLHIDAGDLDKAETALEQAVDQNPAYLPALNNLGNLLKIRGDIARAATTLTRAAMRPDAPAETYWNLAAVKTFTADDPEIAHMERVVAAPNRPERDKILAGFALGKARGDIGDTEAAFAALTAANRLQKTALGYDSRADARRFDALKAAFPQAGQPAAQPKPSGPVPIFIVGMPRSGTTLVETMLSAHPMVHAGGEIETLNSRLSALDWSRPDPLKASGPEIAAQYLARLEKGATDAPFVTDKLPINFLWIGAITALFPSARIIHVTRDARATCWSNFTHYYSSGGNGFAYDLDDIAAYYRGYADLMHHWDTLFADHIHSVDYDALTEAPEPAMRALLDHVGLDWDQACLAPEKNRRAVFTSSANQVRRPIYTGSSRAWQAYAALIGAAFDDLD